MASIFGADLGIDVPGFFSSSAIGSMLTWLLIAIIVVIACSIGIYIYITNRTFSKKIEIYENVAGRGWERTGLDRARIVKIGDGGEEILFLKKRKTYRTAYGKKMGKNTYWFAVGQDGYWYNVLLGDLDAKMGMLDIEPVDRDMRYMHVAIRKNIAERYRKISFMEKYGSFMISGILLIVLIVGGGFLIDQIGELIDKATTAVEAAGKLAEINQVAMSKLDTLCSGGSGISPA